MVTGFTIGSTVVDLSHPMTQGMPNFDSAPPYRMSPYYRLGDFELPGGYWGCNEALSMSGHSGTHLDALGHVAQHGELYGGVPVAEAQSGVDGLIVHDIEQVEPIVRHGVLFDIPRLLGVETLDDGFGVDAALLQRAADEHGVTVRDGDCVLVRTGWQRHWSDPQHYIGAPGGVPGVTLSAAVWLADRGAFLIGADTGTVEVTAPGGLELPVHLEALTRRGIYLLENMALDDLATTGAVEFAFICTPLRLRGASGSPVRPIAILG